MTWTRRAFLWATGASVGCAGMPVPTFPFDRGTTPPSDGRLWVRYYSVGCCLVQRGDIAVLSDPFFSHLSFPQVAHGDTLPDPAQFTPYLDELSAVRAVVVGHGHYDHVLDLPAVADSLHADARVFASRTVVHTFAPNDLPRPLVAVNDDLARPAHAGRRTVLAGGRLTLLPILSGHPDQIPGVHLFAQRVTEPRTTPPTKAADYQEGETLAWLIDFRDEPDGPIASRVYVQTSSRGLPDGMFPHHIRDEAPVDVAVLAMDCARAHARGDRSMIDFLRPSEVVFVHWEDFFRPKQDPPVEGAKNHLFALRKALVDTEETRFRFPYWDSTFVFRRPDDGG